MSEFENDVKLSPPIEMEKTVNPAFVRKLLHFCQQLAVRLLYIKH